MNTVVREKEIKKQQASVTKISWETLLEVLRAPAMYMALPATVERLPLGLGILLIVKRYSEYCCKEGRQV